MGEQFEKPCKIPCVDRFLSALNSAVTRGSIVEYDLNDLNDLPEEFFDKSKLKNDKSLLRKWWKLLKLVEFVNFKNTCNVKQSNETELERHSLFLLVVALQAEGWPSEEEEK